MTVDINEIAQTISNVKKNRNSLDILLEIEGIFDTLHLYAYENWIHGEVIRGPVISKYWVELYIMFPEKQMPNPDGAQRLIKHGCHVFFQKDTLEESVKVADTTKSNPFDAVIRQQQPKTNQISVYVVKVVVPRHLLTDYAVKKVNALSGSIDIDDVIDAYDRGLDVDRTTQSQGNDDEE
jgi:hypothetical protein